MRLQELAERLGLPFVQNPLENLLQTQFLLQMIALPLGCSVLLPEAAIRNYRVQLAVLEHLGLLVVTKATDLSIGAFQGCFGHHLVGDAKDRFAQASSVILSFSDVFQLLQFPSADQLNYQKVYNITSASRNGQLYVESTGRVSYLRSGKPEEDDYYEALLEIFCDVVYDLPNMLVCQLSEKQVRQSRVSSSLVARFLVKNSSASVPVDLINLLDSWENKDPFIDCGEVCVFEFETRLNDKSATPVLDRVLYHQLCIQAREFLLWYDADFVSNAKTKRAVDIIINVISLRPDTTQESHDCVSELEKMISERENKLQVIVKQEYVEKLEEKIHEIQEHYSVPRDQELFRQWEMRK